MTTAPGLRVLIAPDSFKGTCPADEVAAAIAEGWRAVRPGDEVVLLPQADGGEGTLDAVLAAAPVSVHHVPVDLPIGPHRARWLLTEDGTAVVELAECCGLPLVGAEAPLTASTRAVGQVIGAALDAGADRVLIGIGGSASTDGGAGCLAELGLRITGADGHPVADGGGPLGSATAIDTTGLRPPPPGGVELWCDVTAPLFGPAGAAYVFGPQKGADQDQLAVLDASLRRWHALVGGAADQPGAGAAGGIAYGLASLWSARLVPGAAAVARLTGLADAIAGAAVIITGEGRFDAQSLLGKVPGHALDLAAGRPLIVVAGRVSVDLPAITPYPLEILAGSTEAAMADPHHWLVEAGRCAATDLHRS